MFKDLLSSSIYGDGLSSNFIGSALDYIETLGGIGEAVELPKVLSNDYVLFSSKDTTSALVTVHFFKEGARVITYLKGEVNKYFIQYGR